MRNSVIEKAQVFQPYQAIGCRRLAMTHRPHSLGLSDVERAKAALRGIEGRRLIYQRVS
jgi:hypothetical protein